jgi:hypothetical protein
VAIRSAISHVIHAPPAASHSLLCLVEAEVAVAVAVADALTFGVAWLFDLPTDIDPTTDLDTGLDIQPQYTAPMGL